MVTDVALSSEELSYGPSSLNNGGFHLEFLQSPIGSLI